MARLTSAQSKLLSWATSSPGREIYCPTNPGGECGRALVLDGRDALGRYRVQNASATAWSLLDKGLLRRVADERNVYAVTG